MKEWKEAFYTAGFKLLVSALHVCPNTRLLSQSQPYVVLCSYVRSAILHTVCAWGESILICFYDVWILILYVFWLCKWDFPLLCLLWVIIWSCMTMCRLSGPDFHSCSACCFSALQTDAPSNLFILGWAMGLMHCHFVASLQRQPMYKLSVITTAPMWVCNVCTSMNICRCFCMSLLGNVS